MLTILIVLVVGIASLSCILLFLKGKKAKFRPYVIAGVILSFLIIGTISTRNHPVYKSTMLALNNNNKVVELIGSPVKSGISMQSVWSDTHMKMEFPIKGPKGDGTVIVHAKMENDKWSFEELKVKINFSIYDIKSEIN